MIDVEMIEDYLVKHGKPTVVKEEVKFDGNTTTNGNARYMKPGVKLPKILIKKFYGDPTTWQYFYETFEATVHKNECLSGIE